MKAYVLPIFTFILGILANPFLGEISKFAISETGFLQDKMYFDHCLPIERAYQTVRARDGTPIVSGPTNALNKTSFFMRNETGSSLENLVLVLHPIGALNNEPLLLKSSVVADSVTHSSDYEFEHQDGTLLAKIPRFDLGDSIYVESDFDQAIAMLVEVSAENYSMKFRALPDCIEGKYRFEGPPIQVFDFYSEFCIKGDAHSEFSCKLSLQPQEMELTDQLIEEGFSVEREIVSAVRTTNLWTKLFSD